MNIDGFIAMPSFRPDGRLERLNFGGGSDREKQQRLVDFFTEMKAREHAQKAKAAKAGPAQPQQPHQVPSRQTQQASGGSRAAAGGAMQGQGGQASSPQAASAAAAAPKKRRTLLSGGGRSLSQPYGNETILGA
jgi:hypothetical protein